jgi:DnaK suppressor protein
MPVDDRSDLDIRAMKARLIERREELRHLAEGAAGAREPVELDQTRVGRLSRMDALQSQAMSLETDRRRQVELRRIDGALARIDEGEFGCCVQCGEPIAPKRLELDPTAPNCIGCARAGA